MIKNKIVLLHKVRARSLSEAYGIPNYCVKKRPLRPSVNLLIIFSSHSITSLKIADASGLIFSQIFSTNNTINNLSLIFLLGTIFHLAGFSKIIHVLFLRSMLNKNSSFEKWNDFFKWNFSLKKFCRSSKILNQSIHYLHISFFLLLKLDHLIASIIISFICILFNFLDNSLSSVHIGFVIKRVVISRKDNEQVIPLMVIQTVRERFECISIRENRSHSRLRLRINPTTSAVERPNAEETVIKMYKNFFIWLFCAHYTPGNNVAEAKQQCCFVESENTRTEIFPNNKKIEKNYLLINIKSTTFSMFNFSIHINKNYIKITLLRLHTFNK